MLFIDDANICLLLIAISKETKAVSLNLILIFSIKIQFGAINVKRFILLSFCNYYYSSM